MWGLGGAAFVFAYFQRVAPSVMVGDLMRDFGVGAAVAGNLAAIYFYIYAALQIPVGALLDRFGPRRLFVAAMATGAAGAALFGWAGSLEAAYLGRFLVGLGSSVTFVGVLAIVARWFPPERFGFMAGMTMVVAMTGAVGGQAPLAAAVAAFGWRPTMLASAAYAVAVAVLVLLFARDRPAEGQADGRAAATFRSLLGDVRVALAQRQTWIVALHCGAASAPIFGYVQLWSVPHLMQRYALERADAALAASLALIGWAVGSPLLGWLSDRLRRRRAPMLATAAFNLAAWSALLYLPLPLEAALVLLFVVGLGGGGAIVSYAAGRESAPPAVAGAAVAFVNMAGIGFGALVQPLIGLLLDVAWDGAMRDGARVYGADAFAFALLVVPGAMALAVLAAALSREPQPRA
jgi:MFS family permease